MNALVDSSGGGDGGGDEDADADADLPSTAKAQRLMNPLAAAAASPAGAKAGTSRKVLYSPQLSAAGGSKRSLAAKAPDVREPVT